MSIVAQNGGSSVADVQKLRHVADRIMRKRRPADTDLKVGTT